MSDLDRVDRKNWQRDHNELTRYMHLSTNVNRDINNPKYIGKILTPTIEKLLRRKITEAEVRYVIQGLRKIDPIKFVGKKLEEITIHLAKAFSIAISKGKCEEEEPDTHEIIKSEMGISSENTSVGGLGLINVDVAVPDIATAVEITKFLGKSGSYGLQQLLNPEALYRHARLFLDSRYRVLDDDGTAQYKWNYINTAAIGQGSVNWLGVVRDIVEIRVYPFQIPYAATADTQHDLITMAIEEFKSQAIIAHEDRKFHFSFDPTVNARFIKLDPEERDKGRFKFNNPITQIDTLTVTFGAPLQKVIFDTDRLSSTMTYSNPAVITTSADHNLKSGDNIIITDFTTASPTRDGIPIAAINNQRGNVVTYLTDTTFSIEVDLSSIRNVLTGTISVTNGSGTVTGTDTLFTTELAAGDEILIEDSKGTQYYHTVSGAPASDTSMTITPVYAGTTEDGIRILKSMTGTISVTNGLPTVTGTGTSFTTEIGIGDIIRIRDSGGTFRDYTVLSISSNTSLTLSSNYAGATEGSLIMFKDNALSGFNFTTYFDSKRTQIELLLTYILPE